LAEGASGSLLGALGVALGILFYTRLQIVPHRIALTLSGCKRLFERKWFFDELYDYIIVRPLRWIAHVSWKGVDSGLIDGSVNGTATAVHVSGWFAARLQTGQLRQYLSFTFFFGVFLTLMYVVW
jgi:NADH-quinone oxidoreductase subunit L